MEIETIDEKNYKIAYNFLKTVPSVNKIDDNILKNGVIVVDNNRVIGSISFEIYDHIGLIRYFVFKKNIENIYLIKLLEELEKNAKKLEIEKLLCVADNVEIEELFKELGFIKVKKQIYLNEERINSTNFTSSNFLMKNISCI